MEAAIRDTIGQTYSSTLACMPRRESKLERALFLYQRTLGPQNEKALKTISLLARTGFLEGKSAQAEKQYSQTLETMRRVLGPEHPETLQCMTGLALTYRVQGKGYSKPRRCRSRALEIKRRVLGGDHPDTLISMGNLAIIYYQQVFQVRRGRGALPADP